MYPVDSETRARIVSALVEGNSLHAVSRMTGVARNTIFFAAGKPRGRVRRIPEQVLQNLSCRRIQCDEIWAFCYAKDKNLPESLKVKFGYGSIWTWTALDADSKLIVSWMVGRRDAEAASEFMGDLASRCAIAFN